jgi:hypothetical protein
LIICRTNASAISERDMQFVVLLTLVAAFRPRVAVCVCGVAARFQPESLAHNLLAFNEDHFDFDVFLSLQIKGQFFSNGAGRQTHPTIYTDLNQGQILNAASKAYAKYSRNFNWTITISTRELKTVQTYSADIGTPDLDRLTQDIYWNVRGNVFGMFVNEEECSREIIVREVEHRIKYDYIVMAREDTFLFRPMDLRPVVALLSPNCTLITRECLNWGGISTRLQVTSRGFGLHLYDTLTLYYKYLFDHALKHVNTESFLKHHVEWVHGKTCEVSIELLPVSVSRYINETEVCFTKYEVSDTCIPNGSKEFVNTHMCQ